LYILYIFISQTHVLFKFVTCTAIYVPQIIKNKVNQLRDDDTRTGVDGSVDG